MELFLASVIFIFGSIFGSFVNVLIDRVPQGKFFDNKRSYCESCKKSLSWYDLIPLFSYIILRGKCRRCKSKIPFRIFVVELLTGLGFVALYSLIYQSLPLISFIMIVLTFCLLTAIFFIDVKHRIIPNSLLIAILLCTLFYHIFAGHDLIPYIITGIVSFLVFFLLFAVTKGKGMGFGDVKFAFVIGFLLGFPASLIAFYAAFLTGAAISIILIIAGKKKARGSVIAFGPFLIIGILIATLFTDEIIKKFF